MNWTWESYAAYLARQTGHSVALPRPTLPPETIRSESRFLAAVIAAAQAAGWMAYHTYRSTRSPAGFPDLILAKPGIRLLCLELKTNIGVVSPEQKEWLTVLGQTQQPLAAVIRPADWQQLLSWLGYASDY